MAVRYAALVYFRTSCERKSKIEKLRWPITGRTDRRTDGQADRVRRIMRPPPREEGRIIMTTTVINRWPDYVLLDGHWCHWWWRNLSVNVVANSNWSYLLFFVSEIHWKVQSTAAWRNQQNAWGSVENRKWLKRNNRHLVTVQIWIPSTSRSNFETFIRSPDSFWVKSCTGEDIGQ